MNSILTFFSITRLVLKRYEPKYLVDEGLQNFVSKMEGAFLFSTRCMNKMLLKCLTGIYLKNVLLLKSFPFVGKFFFIKKNT